MDAACASSLAAVRAAVDELLTRRADVMITDGCDTDNSIVSFLCFSKTPALSPSGRVRPFDTAADGTLLGEGLGMLALKRLADAERDGDRGRPTAFVRLADLVRARDGCVQPVDAGHRARRTGRPPRRGHRPAPHAGCRLPHAPAPPAVVGGPPAAVL
ncbi:beta-ketoacyl synthase N-terminal-like domain-containing protein [Streptomyces huasconensis]|uniref:beta-ketoacyl synthase N-terminal-like domain-containing protein n=1 Tax=Streptomyces huasconensis TaxID=1854574 RepID=UPI0033E894F8